MSHGSSKRGEAPNWPHANSNRPAPSSICHAVNMRQLSICGSFSFPGGVPMLTTLLQAKLHRVRVTRADLHYEGSCGIDEDLLERSGIREFQHLELYDIENGERFTTYAIKAPRGSGEICLNGAAARRVMVGEHVIVCDYT